MNNATSKPDFVLLHKCCVGKTHIHAVFYCKNENLGKYRFYGKCSVYRRSFKLNGCYLPTCWHFIKPTSSGCEYLTRLAREIVMLDFLINIFTENAFWSWIVIYPPTQYVPFSAKTLAAVKSYQSFYCYSDTKITAFRYVTGSGI